jgi:hypothetical protein
MPYSYKKKIHNNKPMAKWVVRRGRIYGEVRGE